MEIKTKKAVATVATIVELNVFDKVEIARCLDKLINESDMLKLGETMVVPTTVYADVCVLLRKLAGKVADMPKSSVFAPITEDVPTEREQQ